MKKGLLLLIMLVLTACTGGGGGGATVAENGQPQPSGNGIVALQFVNGADPSPAKMVAGFTAPIAGRVRVVVTHPNIGGKAYKNVLDIPFGAPSATLELPVGTGFSAEAVYYALGTPNRLTRHGVITSFDIVMGGTTSQVITMNPITANITTPARVVYGATYDVFAPTAAELDSMGLQANWSVTASTAPFSGAPRHLTQAPAATHTGMLAPAVYQPGNIYFQGEFFIKPSLLESGESATNWSFVCEPANQTPFEIQSIEFGANLPPDVTPPKVVSFNIPMSKQGTTTIPLLNIVGTDEAGVAGYLITESATQPASSDPRWTVAMPTKYVWSGTPAHAVDTPVHLWAWVKDYSGNVSLAESGVSDKTAIVNDSPVVTAFTVPTATQFSTTNIPVSITGKNYTGPDSALQYLVTEKPITPAADAAWVAGGPTQPMLINYDVTTVVQTSGSRYSVPLFAWVRDANGSISQLLSNAVTISDLPQVSNFSVLTSVPNGSLVDILSFTGAAASGDITHYLITQTGTKPLAADFVLTTAPTTYTYTGLAAGVGVTKVLYAWVKDSSGRISLAKTMSVHFSAP